MAARLPAQAIAAGQEDGVVFHPQLAQLLRGDGRCVHGLDNTACEGAPNLLASKDQELWWASGGVFHLTATLRVSVTR